MSNLLDLPNARAWAKDAIERHSDGIFGKIVPSVIWTDARGEDGQLIVEVDPSELVNGINKNPYMLLHNHDPGRPIGRVIESAMFESGSGTFVAAVLGFYAGGDVLGFDGLEVGTSEPVDSPSKFPTLPNNVWVQVASDPREVDAIWLDEVADDAPVRIERVDLSHNAAHGATELIRVGIVFVILAWNPFAKAFAEEAGKKTYGAIHEWLAKLLAKLPERRNPVLDIHSYQGDCQVSFLIRERDPESNYLAHHELNNAARQAARLIAKLRARGNPACQLIYEFDKSAKRWFPSYAILQDDRIVTDNRELIAIEQLPPGLSLGLTRGKFHTPVVSRVTTGRLGSLVAAQDEGSPP
jgi:hypothetical protein